MAACPHCGLFLDEHHRWRGLWRRRARLAGIAVAGALIGVTLRVLIPSASPEPIGLIVAGLLGRLWSPRSRAPPIQLGRPEVGSKQIQYERDDTRRCA
jgi:hypothetical protein